MSAGPLPLLVHPSQSTRGMAFGTCALAFILGTALVAGLLPIEFSIVSVFLAAGPHNWVEARYFLSRLPARWGRLWPFFLLGGTGVLGLTISFAVMPSVLVWLDAEPGTWLTSHASWNTALVLWIATLVHLRSRQNPRRDWGWVWPVAGVGIALAWWWPMLWGLALVYLHPLVALWILDREISRTQPEFRRVYRCCLMAVLCGMALIGVQLVNAPDLVGDDLLRRITHHAGAHLLGGVSSHCLVALHAFLEAVHYGVWLLAIPWLGRQSNLWRIADMPLAKRSLTWTRVLQFVLLASAVIVVVLWLCFWANYPLTRDVYFTLAMVHVLAEVPFLLRAL
jgi:hypothetical protein